jgi:hypothetical protein
MVRISPVLNAPKIGAIMNRFNRFSNQAQDGIALWGEGASLTIEQCYEGESLTLFFSIVAYKGVKHV